MKNLCLHSTRALQKSEMKCTTLQLSLPSTNNKKNNKHTCSFMARFTAQGGLNLLINGERLCFAFDSKDPFLCKGGKSVNNKRSKIRYHGCTKICSLGKKSNNGYSVDERLGGGSNNKDCKDEFDHDHGGGGEYAKDELSCFRGLVLDISYRPVNVVCWKRAICLEFMEKADVLEYYDQTVNSPSGSFYIPAVLRITSLLQVVKRRRVKQTLSRKSIFFRDAFTCQYCSSRESLTIDHVLPIARGGEWTWDNLVTACARCNSRKGPKTLEEANMKLFKVPKAPKESDILAIPLTTAAIKSMKKKSGLPVEWRQYLG